MQKFSIITYLNEKVIDKLKEYLIQQGFEIYELNGKKINDAKSFFKAIINILPLDPPLSESVNYDAFVDSVWGGLDELGKERVALIWNNSDNMLLIDYDNFTKICKCFSDLEMHLKTTEFGLEKPISFLIFMMGNGEKFNSFI